MADTFDYNADILTGETTEKILKLPESSNPINNLTIIGEAGGGRTVTVTVNTQSASALDPDAYEAPTAFSVVDTADGLPKTFLFPIGTMLNKIKFTPSAEFAYSAKHSSAR